MARRPGPSKGMKMTWNNPRLEKRGRDGVRYWLGKFEDGLKRDLSGSRSGRTYYLPGGGSYVASAPGEYPAVKLDELRSSIRVVIKTDQDSTTGTIGTDAPHGLLLETLPVRKGGRPWLSRHWDENKHMIKDGLERQFKKTE